MGVLEKSKAPLVKAVIMAFYCRFGKLSSALVCALEISFYFHVFMQCLALYPISDISVDFLSLTVNLRHLR